VAALAKRFVESRAGGSRTLSPLARARLTSYAWPGNVRELENVMQRALLLSEGEASIEPAHLAIEEHTHAHARLASTAPAVAVAATSAAGGLAGEMWGEETRRIVTALESTRGARKQAAEQLGISDRTLRYKLQKMRAAGIQVPGDRIQ
jgi:two-component system response regulator FlrC